jgi:hypothetical protein
VRLFILKRYRMIFSTRSKTQSTTILMQDIRQLTQCIVKEAGEIKRYYQGTSLRDEVKLARDIGLMLLEEWILSVEVELYEPATRKKVFAYSYRPKVDPNASRQEPGSFKRFRKKQGLRFRIIVITNPAKDRKEADAFFNLLGWPLVDPLIESGLGKTERDGGFRFGGFTAERWVYSDDDTRSDGNTTEGGYR